MRWVLILWFANAGTHGPVTPTAIDGFASDAACVRAGERFVARTADAFLTGRYVCVNQEGRR
jgi:hypothetical protein